MFFEEGWHLIIKASNPKWSPFSLVRPPVPTDSFHDKPAKPPTTSSSDPSVTRLQCFAKVTLLETNRIVEGTII